MLGEIIHSPGSEILIYPAAWIAVYIALFCCSTFITTKIRSFIATEYGRDPPGVPYWIPFVGNFIPLVRDPANFFASVKKRYGNKTPVRMVLGPVEAYIVSTPEYFDTLLKAGKQLSPKPGIVIGMKNMFGTPADVLRIYKADNSGIGPTALPGTNVKPQNRVFYLQHAAAHKFLSGQALRVMTERFMRFLSADMASDVTITKEWTEGPDLFVLFQKQVFGAATRALFGPWLLRLNPSFTQDFWKYADEIPTLLKGLPRFMTPEPYRARDRVLDSIKKWQKFASEHSDYHINGPEAPEWDEFWGSKYLKVRQQNGRAMDSMTDEAMAAEDLALLVAANANAIVTACWFGLMDELECFKVFESPKALSD